MILSLSLVYTDTNLTQIIHCILKRISMQFLWYQCPYPIIPIELYFRVQIQTEINVAYCETFPLHGINKQ